VLAGGALATFFVFFRRSNTGLAMRAVAIDQEASMAPGINVRTVRRAVVGDQRDGRGAGRRDADNGRGGSVAVDLVHRARAFPADDPRRPDPPSARSRRHRHRRTQTLTAGYQPGTPAWLATTSTVMPYVVMVAILMVRPYGLFGTREVDRA